LPDQKLLLPSRSDSPPSAISNEPQRKKLLHRAPFFNKPSHAQCRFAYFSIQSKASGRFSPSTPPTRQHQAYFRSASRRGCKCIVPQSKMNYYCSTTASPPSTTNPSVFSKNASSPGRRRLSGRRREDFARPRAFCKRYPWKCRKQARFARQADVE